MTTDLEKNFARLLIKQEEIYQQVMVSLPLIPVDGLVTLKTTLEGKLDYVLKSYAERRRKRDERAEDLPEALAHLELTVLMADESMILDTKKLISAIEIEIESR